MLPRRMIKRASQRRLGRREKIKEERKKGKIPAPRPRFHPRALYNYGVFNLERY